MKQVLLIGGSPQTGKSTIAKELAAKLKWACIPADDIGRALQTVTDVNPISVRHDLAYYAETEQAQLVEDTLAYQASLQPAIIQIAKYHAQAETPVIIEGWAIFPEIIEQLDPCHVSAVWLTGTERLLETRLRAALSFYLDEEQQTVRENLMYHSMWQDRLIRAQCDRYSQLRLELDGTKPAPEIAEQILDWMQEKEEPTAGV